MPKNSFQKIGLIAKRDIAKNHALVKKVHAFLNRQNCELYLDEHVAPIIKRTNKGLSTKQILKQVDLAVALGGDGTLLRIARALSENPVLVLSINLGRLGFIAEVKPKDALSALRKTLAGKYKIDARSLLEVTVSRGSRKITKCLALNDAVINQGSFARLIDLHVYVAGQKATHFRADGLIISTPTGSTGHSLSAEGPIVHPSIPAFILNPLCPTDLANRALLIPEEKSVRVKIDTPRRYTKHLIGLTIDGQENFILKSGDEIEIQKAKPTFRLATFKNQYFALLREKLNWGR